VRGELNNPKLLDRVRAISRLKHYSIRTEQAYTDWIRRFIVFHSKRNNGVWRHPREMTEAEVSEFLTYHYLRNAAVAPSSVARSLVMPSAIAPVRRMSRHSGSG
jgi:hypothetical protein